HVIEKLGVPTPGGHDAPANHRRTRGVPATVFMDILMDLDPAVILGAGPHSPLQSCDPASGEATTDRVSFTRSSFPIPPRSIPCRRLRFRPEVLRPGATPRK